MLFLVALVCLGLCPALLRWRFGPGWAMRPFALLVFAAIIYHGASEILIRILGDDLYAPYRPPQPFLDEGMLAASAALVAMTVGYIAVAPHRVTLTFDREALARVLDWRITALLALPLLWFTVRGEGYSAYYKTGASVSFSAQFLMVLVVATALGLLLRYPRWFVPIIVGQTLVVALAGQRLEIAVAAVTLSTSAVLVGLKPSRRQFALTAVLLVVAGVGISSVRSTQGRDVFFDDTGTSARLTALQEGVLNPTYRDAAGAGLAGDVALRLDGNTWAGATMLGLEVQPPIGPHQVGNTLLNSVPSFLYPQKNSRSAEALSPAYETRNRMMMANGDVAQGHIGLYLGAFGPWVLLLFTALVGILLGFADRWVLDKATALRVLGFILLGQAALQYERGLVMYLLAGRSLLVLGALLLAWGILRQGPRDESTAQRPWLLPRLAQPLRQRAAR